jgi:hypothetical protein
LAIEYDDMKLILTTLKREEPVCNGRLLILGDAVIHFSVNQYIALAKELGFELKVIPRSLTPFALGESLGFVSTDTLDINGRASLTLNLQQQLPQELLGQFDCLIDAGVLFWCFDPASALKNIYRLVRENGLIVHITAVAGFYGRGYYNIHPLLLEDFYLANNAEYICAEYRATPRHSTLLMRVKSLLRLKDHAGSVSKSTNAGNVFLDEGKAGIISFTNRLRVPESGVIPNNAVGTFVFKKCTNTEPKEPLRK